MTLQVTHEPDVGSVRLSGEIDLESADEFEQAVSSAMARGAFVLDFSDVTFMDSTGLRVLLKAAARTNGVPLTIADPAPVVRRLFEITVPDGAPGLRFREA
jgi:anti-sigma B factor antagonist